MPLEKKPSDCWTDTIWVIAHFCLDSSACTTVRDASESVLFALFGSTHRKSKRGAHGLQ
jgi:hypothetical protein